MNRTDEILSLIQSRPNIRDVEIADQVDEDVDAVLRLLAAPIKSGQILVSDIQAPNGLVVHAYRINPLLQKPAISLPVAPVVAKPPIEETPMPSHTHAAVKVTATVNANSGESKVSQAIAFLKTNGPATSEQLKTLLGLKKEQSPTQYLGSAIRNNRMTYNGKIWAISTGKPSSKNAGAPAPECRLPRVQSAPAAKPANAPPPARPAETVMSSLSLAGISIIEWSRGNIVISSGTDAVDLPAHRAKVLRTYFSLTAE